MKKENLGFKYFYKYLNFRVFVVILSSTLVGFMDSLGISMIIPIFTLSDNQNKTADLENLGFIGELLAKISSELDLFQSLILMSIFFVFKALFIFFSQYYLVLIQQLFLGKIRQELIQELNNIKYDYFVKYNQGKLQSTFSGEVERVFNGMVSYFQAIQIVAMITTYILIATASNIRFSILVVLSALITLYFYKWLNQFTKTKSIHLSDLNATYQNNLLSHIQNFKYIKVSGYIDFFRNKLFNDIKRIEQTRKSIGFIAALISCLREPIVLLSIGIVVAIEIKLFSTSFSTLLVTLLLFFRALNYLSTFQNSWNRYLASSGSIINLNLVLKDLKRNSASDGLQIINEFNSLELNSIHLKFGSKNVLNNVNIKVQKGESIAFVGTSGSGKSSIINIITGLYSATSGSLLINGIDSKLISYQSFQKKIGYITQDSVIFNDSIKNNITLWNIHEPFNPDKFFETIEKASLVDYISDLNLKEESIVGSSGIDMSGGQKQRISIAREIYKNPEILILDEATSSLDSQTEFKIQESLKILQNNCTLIIIAHRLSTIKEVNRIYLVDNGEIVDFGGFQELIEKNKLFKKMVEKQNF